MTSHWLRPSCVRKVRFYSEQKNTFGLWPGLPENGGTCPGATQGVGGCLHKRNKKGEPTCYVYRILRAYRNSRATLRHNSRLLQRASRQEMEQLLEQEFRRFMLFEEYHASTYEHRPFLVYRLHWSGDLFSAAYAKALAKTCQEFSGIRFWMYTRSFGFLGYFRDVPNLVSYLSLDPVNAKKGMRVFEKEKQRFKGPLQLSFMSEKKQADKPYTACPVDAGKLAMPEGCSRCKMCFRSQPRHIWFAS